jgi:hypothetical protein
MAITFQRSRASSQAKADTASVQESQAYQPEQVFAKQWTFFSDEPCKRIKIPPMVMGDSARPMEYIYFKDYKYVTTDKYIANVLRRLCSPHGLMEIKK